MPGRIEVEEVGEDVHAEPHAQRQDSGERGDDDGDGQPVAQQEEEIGLDRLARKALVVGPLPPRF